MQFRSRCSRVPQLACDRSCGGVRSPVPCFLFQKGGSKRECFRKHTFLSFVAFFFFLSFLPSSLFSPRPTDRQFFVYPRSVRRSFASTVFFNVKNVSSALLSLFFFFLTSLSCRPAVLAFTLKCARASYSCAFALLLSDPPLLTPSDSTWFSFRH